jgi:hypothetical protein
MMMRVLLTKIEKINEEDKAEAKKIMKTGKMATSTRRRCSKN